MLALWKYSNEPPKSKLLLYQGPLPTAGSLYRTTFSCMAATKEIQRVIARHH